LWRLEILSVPFCAFTLRQIDELACNGEAVKKYWRDDDLGSLAMAGTVRTTLRY
jgi:hypothetical protein